LLFGSGAAIGYIRNIYKPVLDWIQRKLWISVEVSQPDRMYFIVNQWLSHINATQKSKVLYVTKKYDEDHADFVPGFGYNVIRHQGKIIILLRTKTDVPGGFDSKRVETLTLSVLFGSRKFVEKLIKETLVLDQTLTKEKNQVFLWEVSYEDCWTEVGTHFRPLDSVILPSGVANKIRTGIQRFKNSSEDYTNKGIPYRHGILLEGVPGSGKTSLVSGLANDLKMSLYIVNLSDMLDKKLIKAISKVPSNSIILFEDIDVVAPTRAKQPLSVSLSTFINVLDGFLSGHGNIFCMTTNHSEKLDPAITRAGRVDTRVYFDYANTDQIRRMFVRFHPESTKKEEDTFVRSYRGKKVTTSQLQERLLQNAEEI